MLNILCGLIIYYILYVPCIFFPIFHIYFIYYIFFFILYVIYIYIIYYDKNMIYTILGLLIGFYLSL